ETRVVVADGNQVEEFDFESENRRQLSGNIYLAKVTRVEPSLQAAFVEYGGNRHGFLAFSEIHPDYYKIPVADREALLAEEMEIAEAEAKAEEEEVKPKRRRRSGTKAKAELTATNDESISREESVDDVIATETASESVEAITRTDVAGEEDESPAVPSAEPDEDTSADIPSMSVIDLGDEESDQPEIDSAQPTDASARDETIESIADDDTAEEIRRPRRQRQRQRNYKIQEVIEVRQILLVQVVKEERGNKGAALTTYLSLAGRYCVLMPNTARGGGISRKITSASDRKKLKAIADGIEIPKGAGLIIRTAGAQRTKSEIKRDYEYLQRLWEQIRELTLKSIAPAQIYEEGNLIKRSIRDLYSREIDEVLVEGEAGFRTAKDFMKMIMPSHAKNVKQYNDPMPLFARHQVESYLGGMFNPVVQLKSGGYIVIGQTEALVAIDVNSGRATKEGSIESTALKTNLEAAEEVARQLRLRDLAGLIVIDFIDMDERKNNTAVEKRFKEKLKTDRARIQIGRISGFGLLEMSRQRLRPGVLEASTQPCPSCHGTGLLRSIDSLSLTILRQLEEEGVRKRAKEVLLRVPVPIINFLMNTKRDHIAQIEARYSITVRLEADPHLIPPEFSIEKFKTAARKVDTSAPVVSADASLMAGADDEIAHEEGADATIPEDDGRPKKRRRRRRRRRGKGVDGQGEESAEITTGTEAEAETDVKLDTPEKDPEAKTEDSVSDAKPKRQRRRRKKTDSATEDVDDAKAAATEGAGDEEEPAESKPKRRRSRKKKEPSADAEPQTQPDVQDALIQVPMALPEGEPDFEPTSKPDTGPAPEPVIGTMDDGDADRKPRRIGWWSRER
ncbi:MAG: ribonuclease E/G, partial [Boseongicola sp.]|nr:ribonuclease E/G [Boseongicola sp.]